MARRDDLPAEARRLLARAERLVRIAALLVPDDIRADWRREWSAELFYRTQRLAQAGTPSRIARNALLARAAGALPHALWLRLEQWRLNVQDIRFGLRSLARQPVFAIAIVGTLALGIGANTTMFTLINAVLLQPLGYHDPSALIWACGSFPGNASAAVSPPDFVDYRQRNHVFSSMGAMALGQHSVSVVAGAEPERVASGLISTDLLPTLGVQPALGRLFRDAEGRAGAAATALIGHRLWCDRFACDPTVLNRSISIDGEPTVVVGVLPDDFRLPFDSRIGRSADIQVWRPLRLDAADMQVRRFHSLAVVARLRPQVTLREAQADVDVIAGQLARAYPENATWTLRLVPLHEQVVANVKTSLLVLQIVVGLVLLVACGNVASLMLARASTRVGEMAVRRALGASRTRLLRQLLTETLLLAFTGGVLAMLLAWWSLALVRAMAPPSIPRIDEVRIDSAVLLFTALLVLATTVACGLTPALHTIGSDMASAVKGARASEARSPRRVRGYLVVTQVAASAVLLVAAGLLMRSLWSLQAVQLGFDSTQITTTQLWLDEQRYPSEIARRQAYELLVDNLRRSPGIERAALINIVPMTGANDTMVYAYGHPPATAADRRYAQIRIASPEYFEAMRIRRVAGRTLAVTDNTEAPPVVVINETMAREHFGAANAVGRQLVIDLRDPITAEVVGVVGDVREFGPAEPPPPTFYFSSSFLSPPVMAVVVRSRLSPSALIPGLRTALHSVDPMLALGRIEPMGAILGKRIEQARFRTVLLGGFATVALALTVVGLYGALAYLVALRSREIGIRLALGAGADNVTRLVMQHGASLVAAGLLLGTVVALWGTRVLAGFLFMVSPRDPLVFATVACTIGACGLLAAFIPARRASRVDPLLAIRSDGT